MKGKGKSLIVIAVLAFLLFAPAKRVVACTCAPEDPDTKRYIETELDSATAVFSGRVIKTQKIGYSLYSQQDMVRATFEVYTIWKGKTYQYYIVENTDCEYPFRLGYDYLVFAYGDANNLKSYYCSPTIILGMGNADLYIQYLGEGHLPDTENPNLFRAYVYPASNNAFDFEAARAEVRRQNFIYASSTLITLALLGALAWIIRIKTSHKSLGNSQISPPEN